MFTRVLRALESPRISEAWETDLSDRSMPATRPRNRLTDNWLTKNGSERAFPAGSGLFPCDRRNVDTQIVLRGFPCVIEPHVDEAATLGQC